MKDFLFTLPLKWDIKGLSEKQILIYGGLENERR